jgi:hypothetical protein
MVSVLPSGISSSMCCSWPAWAGGRMFIETSGAFFKVVVKEPDDALEMLLNAPSLDDVLALADLMLGAEKAPWAPDPFAQRRQGGGKKK